MTKTQASFHLHLISDATGETLLAAGRAAAAQYREARAIEHIYPLIRTDKQLAKVFEEIDAEPGIVLYTVVDERLAGMIDRTCAAMGLPFVSVLEPVFSAFQSFLGAPSGRKSGAQHDLDAGYFQRIDALNFTMEHDDGKLPLDIEEAAIVIVGIGAVIGLVRWRNRHGGHGARRGAGHLDDCAILKTAEADERYAKQQEDACLPETCLGFWRCPFDTHCNPLFRLATLMVVS